MRRMTCDLLNFFSTAFMAQKKKRNERFFPVIVLWSWSKFWGLTVGSCLFIHVENSCTFGSILFSTLVDSSFLLGKFCIGISRMHASFMRRIKARCDLSKQSLRKYSPVFFFFFTVICIIIDNKKKHYKNQWENFDKYKHHVCCYLYYNWPKK